MDALALLCSLYGDGPATLHRLRGNGCESLAALLDLQPDALSELLDWEERPSIRFLREAQSLAERLDLGWDEEEREDVDAAETGAAGHAVTLPAAAPIAKRDQAPDATRESLLERWRELDHQAPPSDPEAPVATAGADPAPPVWDARLDQLGLSDGQTRALRGAGVMDLEALMRRDAFELARVLGLAYTRAKRLQLLARKGEQAGPAGERTGTPRSRAASVASASRGDADPGGSALESAGPFA